MQWETGPLLRLPSALSCGQINTKSSKLINLASFLPADSTTEFPLLWQRGINHAFPAKEKNVIRPARKKEGRSKMEGEDGGGKVG